VNESESVVKSSEGGRARKTYKKTQLLREELLNAAEELFAERGFEKTSVRDITNHLGVRLAAVNYHFDSKLNLLVEMIHRRAGSLNHAREVRLNAVEIDKEKPYETVRALICAMWEPLLQYYLSGDPGWRYYCRYLARMIGADEPEFREILNREYNPVAKSFLKKLKSALPHCSEYQLHCAHQFMIGSFTFVMSDNKRIDGISEGKFRSQDLESVLTPHFFDYATAGILGLLKK
jgi:AcrR family transcriptional regulator